MSRGAWFAEPLAQADGSRACEPNLNGAVSGAPSHLRDSIGRRGLPAASATFSPAATFSPRSIPRVSEFRGALAGGFGPRPFIPGSAMRAVLQNFDTSPELGGNERRVRADGLHGFNHEASNGQEVVNLCQGVGNA